MDAELKISADPTLPDEPTETQSYCEKLEAALGSKGSKKSFDVPNNLLLITYQHFYVYYSHNSRSGIKISTLKSYLKLVGLKDYEVLDISLFRRDDASNDRDTYLTEIRRLRGLIRQDQLQKQQLQQHLPLAEFDLEVKEGEETKGEEEETEIFENKEKSQDDRRTRNNPILNLFRSHSKEIWINHLVSQASINWSRKKVDSSVGYCWTSTIGWDLRISFCTSS